MALILYIDKDAAIKSGAIYFLCGVLLLLIPMFRSYWRLRGRPRPEKVSIRRIHTIEIYSLIVGIFWAISFYLLLPQLHEVDAVYVLGVAFFLWFGSVALNPSQPRTIVAYCAPFLTATFLSAFKSGIMPPGLAAFFLFNTLFGLVQSARQNWQDVKASVLLSLQRQREQAEHNRILEEISNQLGKYMSPQLYQSIFRGEQKVEIVAKRKKLTVFFSDIVGFTEITEQMESEELTALLNRYLSEMSEIALQHNGTIDKFIGDAIVIYFGDPESLGVKEDADQCVRMAMAMQQRVKELDAEWLDMGLERTIDLRIGINTGYCTVGNFGSDARMDYTIIGSEVNLASRLETTADVGGILLANETYSLVKDWVDADEGAPITVKGFSRPVRTFRVRGMKTKGEANSAILHQEMAGLSLTLDATQMNADGKRQAVDVLRHALNSLEG